jgi:hypothetical protein
MTRLLVLMGSGETAPTMVKPHRAVFDLLGADPPPAVILDTPYGFQENAGDISTRAVGYFANSVGRPVAVAGLPRPQDMAAVDLEAALARVAAARWVFAGPGSPTYALSQWRGTEVPNLIADKLAHEGCVVFASAAALTLGGWTVPVYEIYKVGTDPAWEPGLGLLAPLGLPVAVIPHYDNAEGGGHDTRFCYLGERRLRMLEDQLPDGAWVLGVDEHTALLVDLDAGEATVMGNGGVTIRRRGRSSVLETGTRVRLEKMAAMAAGVGGRGLGGGRSSSPGPLSGGSDGGPSAGSDGAAAGSDGAAAPVFGEATPLAADIRRLEAEFTAAADAGHIKDAVRAVLDLDDTLADWASDTNQSDDVDRGRAALRRMVVRLGELAEIGARDPAVVVGPFVDALLAERAQARAERRFEGADRIRDGLVALGVEVRDTPAGTRWDLRTPRRR